MKNIVKERDHGHKREYRGAVEHWEYRTLKELIKMEKNCKKRLSYRSQFIDSARFIPRSLSDLVNNLSEKIIRFRFEFGHDDKKCEKGGI